MDPDGAGDPAQVRGSGSGGFLAGRKIRLCSMAGICGAGLCAGETDSVNQNHFDFDRDGADFRELFFSRLRIISFSRSISSISSCSLGR